MTYTLKETNDGWELHNYQGDIVWTTTGEMEWPNPDAIQAMLDDAQIGNPQQSLFETMFLGPDWDRQSEQI